MPGCVRDMGKVGNGAQGWETRETSKSRKRHARVGDSRKVGKLEKACREKSEKACRGGRHGKRRKVGKGMPGWEQPENLKSQKRHAEAGGRHGEYGKVGKGMPGWVGDTGNIEKSEKACRGRWVGDTGNVEKSEKPCRGGRHQKSQKVRNGLLPGCVGDMGNIEKSEKACQGGRVGDTGNDSASLHYSSDTGHPLHLIYSFQYHLSNNRLPNQLVSHQGKKGQLEGKVGLVSGFFR